MVTCKDISDMYRNGKAEDEILRAFREVNPDDRNGYEDNRTPLHLACYNTDIEAARILLERGADINVKDDKGVTPICTLAMRSRYYPIDEDAAGKLTERMLSAGARVPRSGKDTTALIEAVRNRHYIMADAIIRSGCRLDSTDHNGENALHVICSEAGNIAGDIRTAEKKIESFADTWYSDKDKEDIRKSLEKLRETEKQCNSTAKKLIESGQIDLDEKSNSGKTAFDISVEDGARWIGALLSGQDPETDELAALAGGMDIFQALYRKDRKAIEALLRSGIDLQTACEYKDMYDFYGKSPLACALLWKDFDIAEMLLMAGADPNWKSPEEQTAFAVWMNKNEQYSKERDTCQPVFRQMSQSGWKIEASVDGEGNSALSLACRNADKERGAAAVRYLLSTGADVNARNLSGQTPAMNLFGGKFWDGNIHPVLLRAYPYGGRRCEETDVELLELLLESGAQTDVADKWGNTLLHYIAASTARCESSGRISKEAAELVFDFGSPDVNAVNNEGKTALDIAAEMNNEPFMKLLLKHL